MNINFFRKYCVDDIVSSKNNQDAIFQLAVLRQILTMLEHYPNTGENLRKKYADSALHMGLKALSQYVLAQYKYEEFFQAAKQEQIERLKNCPKNIIMNDTCASLDMRLQSANQKKFKAEEQYAVNKERIKKEHQKQIQQLQQKQIVELEQLSKEHQESLQKIQNEINEIIHLIKLENDPEYAAAYHAKQKRQQEERERLVMEQKYLRSFDINSIMNKDRNILFPILRKLSIDERLSDDEKIWLETEGKNYFTKGNKVYITYHRIEAEYECKLFNTDKNVWHAVNASSHFRKANMPQEAAQLLAHIQHNKISSTKLKSAFFTTFGGVNRDLGYFHDGIEMAQKAHKLSPKNYKPCTLLGALYFEIREYETGTKWFEKAEQLGAQKHNTDAEIKAIYHKANKEKKKELRIYLLSLDAKRYAWLNQSEKQN